MEVNEHKYYFWTQYLISKGESSKMQEQLTTKCKLEHSAMKYASGQNNRISLHLQLATMYNLTWHC